MSSLTFSTTELAKRAAAQRAVEAHLQPHYTRIGIGSGSTIAHVVTAIAALPSSTTSKMRFLPTGQQSADLLRSVNLPLLYLADLDAPDILFPQGLDVYFDGADEVDERLNCIKGGGACQFREKLVAQRAKLFICIADSRKRSDRLLRYWTRGVPIEVHPEATSYVLKHLALLGSKSPQVRSGLPGKMGALVTDNGNHVIDAPFGPLSLGEEEEDGKGGEWRPLELEQAIKRIEGVLSVGIFAGMDGPGAISKMQEVGGVVVGVRPHVAYFGDVDGNVNVLGPL